MNRENSRNGIKRNLFGTAPNDHNKIQENLMREASRISREKSEIWNFDFEKFKPLPPGRYKWERVGKRLQTRTSPTLPEDNSDDICVKTIENVAPGTKRHYNLRTRETKEVGTENFRPIEARGCSKLSRVTSEGATSTVKHTGLAKKTKRKHQQRKRKKDFKST
ncbi:uncharacterized protein LOC116302629 [Actinia tenebrosa]|uniref:Uncharacterized protein LOC116302629 n=1 Tax=Actinia tenebrosa TaxID=6105 RepID=A0A6P8IM09_ACTTE|nr:uncharacterized protein LOC116302629 [Actinia tenebrosa]